MGLTDTSEKSLLCFRALSAKAIQRAELAELIDARGISDGGSPSPFRNEAFCGMRNPQVQMAVLWCYANKQKREKVTTKVAKALYHK